ncbi:MAG: hypothetical protein NTX82_07465 [Candidatus Parcubacteria bacterium]|nr:hypothetical protein [Candidatus Parcubacteria bacterium]
MNCEITKEESQKAMERGTFFGFIPQRLEIKELPQFYHFPFNVLFASTCIKDGKQVSGSAVYEPDFYTYKKDGHLSCMRYHNIYGGDCHLMIAYDEENKKYLGEKFVNGEKVGSADGGPDWHLFFVHLTLLGLASGEKCKFQDVEEKAGS